MVPTSEEAADGLGALGYATACCAFYKACAAAAAADGAGPGAFKPQLLDALKKAAVDEHMTFAFAHEKTRAGDGPRRAEKSNLHPTPSA